MALQHMKDTKPEEDLIVDQVNGLELARLSYTDILFINEGKQRETSESAGLSSDNFNLQEINGYRRAQRREKWRIIWFTGHRTVWRN